MERLDLVLDVHQRNWLADEVLRRLTAAVSSSTARLRDSLVDGRADACCDIDVCWVVPDAQFLPAVEGLPTILAAVRPVESLRSDPLLQRSRRHRLLFARLADAAPTIPFGHGHLQ